jgi:hypothetical protein
MFQFATHPAMPEGIHHRMELYPVDSKIYFLISTCGKTILSRDG